MFFLRKKLVPLMVLVMAIFIFAACSSEDESSGASNSSSGSTLTTILERGELVCGVNDNLTGFGVVNSAGEFENRLKSNELQKVLYLDN